MSGEQKCAAPGGDYMRALDIKKQFNLTLPEAAAINLAITPAQQGWADGKYASAVEAIQKESLRIAIPANVDLTRLGDIQFLKPLAEIYLTRAEEKR